MSSPFLRARQPEQKRQRYDAILDAARDLAHRDGVGRVYLAGIADAVGMHKSALLRYFGTREEIFLRMAQDEWRGWAAAVTAELAAGGAAEADERVVSALVGSLADRPLLCQLLLHATLTLEHNVSLDAVRDFKTTTLDALDAVADAVARTLPGLAREDCVQLLMTGGLVAAGLWQAAHPSPVVQQFYAERDAPSSGPYGFEPAMARFVRVHLAGLRSVGPATS